MANTERALTGRNRLYGEAAAARIDQAHIAVVGLGGVGSWAAETLARTGVGQLTLIDLDHIAASNLNRQIHALQSTLGQAKVAAMQARIAEIHSNCQVNTIEDFVSFENWPALLGELRPQVVIDACDDLQAKCALALQRTALGYHLITAGAAGGKRLPHRIQVADLLDTTHDRLLAKLRYTLRKQHGAARDKAFGITCVYSTEAATVLSECGPVDGSLHCSGYGSSAAVTASFGHCAAALALEFVAIPVPPEDTD